MKMEAKTIYPDWAYKILIPILIGVAINYLDNIDKKLTAQAVTSAQFEIRISNLEKYHPFRVPKIPDISIPRHMFFKLDQRKLRTDVKI
jgi:hypothetical protein